MKIVFLHHRETNNVGDLTCCPAQYFDFPEHIIADPLTYTGDADILIVGGGGLMGHYFDEKMEKIVNKSQHVVLWGVGSHHDSFRLSKWAENATIIGLRDNVDGINCVPCVSCMSEVFDETTEPTFDKISYFHDHLKWRPSGDNPSMGNHGTTFKQATDFLRLGRSVFTNSYHGVYWSKLLGGNPQLVDNWNSKFDNMPDFGLEHSRELNKDFYQKVISTFNL